MGSTSAEIWQFRVGLETFLVHVMKPTQLGFLGVSQHNLNQEWNEPGFLGRLLSLSAVLPLELRVSWSGARIE